MKLQRHWWKSIYVHLIRHQSRKSFCTLNTNYPFNKKLILSSSTLCKYNAVIQNYVYIDVKGHASELPQTFNELMLTGKFCSDVQMALLKNFITQRETATEEEWQGLKKKVLELQYGFAKPENIDCIILQNCSSFENLSLGKCYFNLMQKTNKKIKLAIILSFIRLIYTFRFKCTDEDAERVKRYADQIIKNSPLIEYNIAEGLVMAYCVAKCWEKCVEVITKKVDDTQSFSDDTYIACILCLLYCNEYERMWNIVSLALKNFAVIKNSAYLEILDKCNDRESVETLLNILSLHDVKPRHSVALKISKLFWTFPLPHKLYGKFTFITYTGKCKNCNEILNSVELNENEFAELRKEFLNAALIGRDIFCTTTPTELSSFLTFVKNTAPYDIVIDGLNVLYSLNLRNPEKRQSRLHSGQTLRSVVQYFAERNNKILLVGKRHMLNLTKDVMNYINRNALVFLMNEYTKDDPFMLYAAMYSGGNTCFVSRDLMRKHKYLLQDTRLMTLFKRWQLSHQYILLNVRHEDKVIFKEPISFEMNIQKNKNGGWHIPYLIDDIPEVDAYKKHNDWLCLSPVKKNSYAHGTETEASNDL